MTTALFIGRFQPFHNAHLKVIKDILKENDRIVVAIGSAQEKYTCENPFSAEERRQMIQRVMDANKIRDYEIVDIPDYYDDNLWCRHIRDKVEADLAYSGNHYVQNCLQRHGFRVNKISLKEGISSSKIREMIKKGKNWEELVPKEIAEFIRDIKGVERIKRLN